MKNPNRLRPIRALAALATLLREPEDTAQVFTIIEALTGRTDERLLRRLHETAEGAAMVAARPDVLPHLLTLRQSERLSNDSFGRAYLNFLETEGISPDGLVEAAAHDPSQHLDTDAGWIRRHLRDTHDLWHVATGYQGDVVGEASLLAFTLAQTGNPGVGLIALGAVHKLEAPEYRRLILDGFRRGLVARWFVSVDWVAMLELPLDEVRRKLRLDDPPEYVPLRE